MEGRWVWFVNSQKRDILVFRLGELRVLRVQEEAWLVQVLAVGSLAPAERRA